ncbi:unnamed protein product [Macrosiphum euphorbiae]|uniref:Uncharacterized protein n=1 Tax=Macrosiphum euphorbiae TaxID=13131 RepID=A0AAV0VZ09_9HEMI|nr:unnamed protein product [Macrosiphum euphorbiae]
MYKFLLAESKMRMTVSTSRRLSRSLKVYLLHITTVEKITIVSSMGLVVVTVEVALREGQSEGKNILIEVTG